MTIKHREKGEAKEADVFMAGAPREFEMSIILGGNSYLTGGPLVIMWVTHIRGGSRASFN